MESKLGNASECETEKKRENKKGTIQILPAAARLMNGVKGPRLFSLSGMQAKAETLRRL